MKKLFNIITLIIISCLAAFAQQEIMFTQYMHNETVINPAYAGSHDVLSLTALTRHQWVGVDGAPNFQTFSAHTPLRNPKLATGLSIINDKIGVSRNLSINNMYVYKLKLKKKKFLQFGLQGGFTYACSDYGDLLINDENDTKFENQYIRKFLPNVGAGLYYYSDKFYAGFSTPQLLQNKISLGDAVTILQQNRHYFLTSGYVFDVNEFLKIKPSIFMKVVTGAPVQMDFSTNFIMKEILWLGFTYRTGDSFDIMGLLQVSEQLRFGYAYDNTLTSLGKNSYGTHEIVVNYRFNFSKDLIITPRYF